MKQFKSTDSAFSNFQKDTTLDVLGHLRRSFPKCKFDYIEGTSKVWSDIRGGFQWSAVGVVEDIT